MPITDGPQIRSIADIVQVLTQCSGSQANAAELEICKDPKAVELLAKACGISVFSIGAGGVLVVTGASASIGLGMMGVGALGAKRYCQDMVEKGTARISDF